MLYATTRSKHDVVTAHKAAHTDSYTDGSLYVPFRMPHLNKDQLAQLIEGTPSQIVAEILNLFFAADITAEDVDKASLRRPVKCTPLGRRLAVAELWHNSSADVSGTVQRLSDRICGGRKTGAPSNWVQIAVRIGLLFAAYGSLLKNGALCPEDQLDVAVTAGDFSMPMAAWYARQMGLNIGHIICGCNSNGAFWDLLNRGEFSTGDVATGTTTPNADIVVPRNLERLISVTLGAEAVEEYLLRCAKGRIYRLSPEQLSVFGKGMFAAVISDARVAGMIPGVYNTTGHVLSPYSALGYGSLQDYRAMTGNVNPALLIEERSPTRERTFVSQLLQIEENHLRNLITG